MCAYSCTRTNPPPKPHTPKKPQDAYDTVPFDNHVANKRDFTFTYPNMAGCLEAEFLQVPLTTVRNYRDGKVCVSVCDFMCVSLALHV